MTPDNNMRAIRKSQGISLDELADKTRLAKSSLSMIERGLAHPLLRTARKIAAALDVDDCDIWPEAS